MLTISRFSRVSKYTSSKRTSTHYTPCSILDSLADEIDNDEHAVLTALGCLFCRVTRVMLPVHHGCHPRGPSWLRKEKGKAQSRGLIQRSTTSKIRRPPKYRVITSYLRSLISTQLSAFFHHGYQIVELLSSINHLPLVDDAGHVRPLITTRAINPAASSKFTSFVLIITPRHSVSSAPISSARKGKQPPKGYRLLPTNTTRLLGKEGRPASTGGNRTWAATP